MNVVRHIQPGKARSAGQFEAARHDSVRDSNSVSSSSNSLYEYRLIRQLEEQDPKLHAFAIESLQAEQEELLGRLDITPAGDEREEIERELWIINGALQEGFDLEVLRAIAEHHRDQGTIPEGYDAEIFCNAT